MSESGPEDERLQAIYDRLDELDPTTFESDASKLLHGLGFEEKMMAKATKDMSGESSTTLHMRHLRLLRIGRMWFWMQPSPQAAVTKASAAPTALLWDVQRVIDLWSCSVHTGAQVAGECGWH